LDRIGFCEGSDFGAERLSLRVQYQFLYDPKHKEMNKKRKKPKRPSFEIYRVQCDLDYGFIHEPVQRLNNLCS
jgi:hypothetical protein